MIFPNQAQFVSNYNSLVVGGSARTLTSIFGETFHLRFGSGQGDPSSGVRFLAAHLLFDAFLNFSAARHRYSVSINEVVVQSTSYADDTVAILNIQSQLHLDCLLRVFDIGKGMGLSINPDKTKILAIPLSPPMSCSPP